MGYLKDKVSVDTGSNVGVAEYQIVAGVTNANSNRVFDIEVLHFEVDKTLLGNLPPRSRFAAGDLTDQLLGHS
jgi:hypothetical protein